MSCWYVPVNMPACSCWFRSNLAKFFCDKGVHIQTISNFLLSAGTLIVSMFSTKMGLHKREFKATLLKILKSGYLLVLIENYFVNSPWSFFFKLSVTKYSSNYLSHDSSLLNFGHWIWKYQMFWIVWICRPYRFAWIWNTEAALWAQITRSKKQVSGCNWHSEHKLLFPVQKVLRKLAKFWLYVINEKFSW